MVLYKIYSTMLMVAETPHITSIQCSLQIYKLMLGAKSPVQHQMLRYNLSRINTLIMHKEREKRSNKYQGNNMMHK